MRWFRANRCVAGWLAFLALACQLSFSFGHIHISKFGAGVAPLPAAQITHVEADAPRPAPEKDPVALAGDFCAVCANISPADALILPILAFILAPGLHASVLRRSPAAWEPASFCHLPFGARGPPHA
jgi:hypothetical protein